ncbi:MAG: hypothetical protein C4527_28255, partial [Candidatus Omnitrophota bacterium]
EAQCRTDEKLGQLVEAQCRTDEKLGQLVEAQCRTDEKLGQLVEAQCRTDEKLGQLVEAQCRTDEKLGQLVEAQCRTDEKLGQLAEAQKRTEEEIRTLAGNLNETRKELGGLSRSVGYSLENEAYRILPNVLKERYGIEIKEKLIRTEIRNQEINILGRAVKNGKDILVVGEAKLRLDRVGYLNRENLFDELEKKVEAAREEFGIDEVIRVIITHYAGKAVLQEAERKGVFVIQSFDW